MLRNKTRRAHSNTGSAGMDVNESESNATLAQSTETDLRHSKMKRKNDEYYSQREINPIQQRCASIMAKKRKMSWPCTLRGD